MYGDIQFFLGVLRTDYSDQIIQIAEYLLILIAILCMDFIGSLLTVFHGVLCLGISLSYIFIV